MAVAVVPYQSAWPVQASQVIVELEAALVGVGVESIEHVGSTSVPGLAAKPVLDIDVIVTREHIGAAIDALTEIGYRHVGDRGIPGREALEAPDEDP
ncbi:MAG: GrpB family protein, partial [Ornithinimicrobium sp.]